jgi:hypothetical protein
MGQERPRKFPHVRFWNSTMREGDMPKGYFLSEVIRHANATTRAARLIGA